MALYPFARRHPTKLFTIVTIVAVTLVFANLIDSLGQNVWYSTSTTYSYATEPYVNSVTSTKTDWQVREWFSIEASTRIEDRNDLVLKLWMRNNLQVPLSNVRLAIGFRFRNETWTKPYFGSVGNFDPQQDKVLDLHIFTDFNLYEIKQPEETDVKYWKVYYVEASTTELRTTTRTLTNQVIFTFTKSYETSMTTSEMTTLPISSLGVDNAWMVAIVILTIVALVLAMIVLRGRKVSQPPKPSQPSNVVSKTLARCIHCGAELPAEAEFCVACGKPQ